MYFILQEISVVGKPDQMILRKIYFIYLGLKLKILSARLVIPVLIFGTNCHKMFEILIH
jgi:hypothetical protein